MSLNSATIRKIFREVFAESPGLPVDPAQLEQLSAKIIAQIQRFDNIENMTGKYYYYGEDNQTRQVCSFRIKTRKKRSYFTSLDFRLVTSQDNTLLLQHYSDQAEVARLEQLDEFIVACEQRLHRQRLQAVKGDKIRALKAQATVARVKKLAQELKFDFMTETDRYKIKVFIKLSEREAVQLNAPFNKFDEVLPHLQSAISSLLELYKIGIRFKLVSCANWRAYAKWISYQDD